MTGIAVTGTELDRAEIGAIEAAYGPRWDLGDSAGWSGLYLPDGVFEVAPVEGRPEVRLEGQVVLAARCDAFNRDNHGVHLLGTPDLKIDGDMATSVVPFSFTGANIATGRVWAVAGLYQVHYERGPEGWRIRHRLESSMTRQTGQAYPGPFRDFAPAG
jgi:hypothetical protein